MRYGRTETLTCLIHTRNLLFDQDGSNIQIFLSLLAFNIVISVETSRQIRLLFQGF